MSKETHWQTTILLVMTFMYAGCFRQTKKKTILKNICKINYSYNNCRTNKAEY